MNDYSKLLNTIDLIKQNAVSAEKTVSSFTRSPELHNVIELSQKAQKELPMVMLRLAYASSVQADTAKHFLEKIAPILNVLARAIDKLRIIERLGEVQFVAWKQFVPDFYEKASKAKSDEDLLKTVYDALEENAFEEVDITINNLLINDHLKDNRLLVQAIKAYRRGDYDIAALGITAVIDRMLSEYSGMITTVNIQKRIEAIKDKIDNHGTVFLDEYDINDYILISTYTNALKAFGDSSSFDDEEPELNRHWLAHGRMNREMVHMDCIRLINFLYGTVLMNKIAEDNLSKADRAASNY